MTDSAKPAGVEELMKAIRSWEFSKRDSLPAVAQAKYDALESALTELVNERDEARILLRSVVDHARRYHQCNDGPFDMADNFLAGKPYKEEPIL